MSTRRPCTEGWGPGPEKPRGLARVPGCLKQGHQNVGAEATPQACFLRVQVEAAGCFLSPITVGESLCFTTSAPLLQHSVAAFFSLWSTIAIQCCIISTVQKKSISYMYTYIPSLLDLLPPSPPSRSFQDSLQRSLCYTAASHWLPAAHGSVSMLS